MILKVIELMYNHTYRLERETLLPVSLEEAWTFFSDPANLAVITPPELNFRIKTTLAPGEFYEGLQIVYTVQPIAGIPLRWVSRIVEVEMYKQFTDIQVAGPFASWVHLHTFEPIERGVVMRDTLDYRLPLGVPGRFAHWLFVRKQLENIFNYRSRRIGFLFNARRSAAFQ